VSNRVKFRVIVIVIALLAALTVFFYTNGPQEEYQTVQDTLPLHYNGEQFAGSRSCIPCHESLYESHIETAHYNTSARANNDKILGSFSEKGNRVNLAGGHVSLIKESGLFYQITRDYKGKLVDKSKIDIVIGSGVKGQSHLTFKVDSLFQLQASYFTLTEDWINSPGFPNYSFKRAVSDNCIKCHVTFAKNETFSSNSNVYDRNSFMYGVDCERCHGPSQKHVKFRKGLTQNDTIDPIISIALLDRQLKMDVCAQCHAGLRGKIVKGNHFSYVTGEKLEDYTKNYFSKRPKSELDVHGNQYGLLTSSACYKKSASMSCNTCHDPHKNQRGNASYFNATCIECHNSPTEIHASISDETSGFQNCIKCHMPNFPSNTMKVQLKNTRSEKSVDIRTHLIGIYIDGLLQKRE